MRHDGSTQPAARPKGPGRALATDIARCLRFYSRLPVPALPWEDEPHAVPDFRTVTRAVPLAGALIGTIGGLVLAGALSLGLSTFVAAALAVASLAAATGAFHEDGLADTADAFGGATVERRLAIMRDSRIGSFGASALILALALRIGLLADLAARLGPGPAAAALILSAALSRTAGLTLFRLGPPARQDGAAHAVGLPTAASLATTWGVTVLLAAGLGLAAPLPGAGLVAGLLLAAAVPFGMARLGKRLVGGHTGDLAGATQQLAEIAVLTGLLIRL